MNIEIQRTAEALNQCDRAGPGRLVGVPRFLDQMRSDDPVNGAQHTPHDLGPTGEQETQLERETQYPLAYGLLGQHFVDPQGRALHHAPCPAAGAETSPFTAKGNPMLCMAGVTTHPQFDRRVSARDGDAGNDQYPDPGWPFWPPRGS